MHTEDYLREMTGLILSTAAVDRLTFMTGTPSALLIRSLCSRSASSSRAFGIHLIRATENLGIVPETFKACQTE
jgi:hypothetical protein